jgi:hypothetical protein
MPIASEPQRICKAEILANQSVPGVNARNLPALGQQNMKETLGKLSMTPHNHQAHIFVTACRYPASYDLILANS